MNFNSLTPEERNLVLELFKRVELWESKLKRLQDKIVKIDGRIVGDVAKSANYLNLN